MAKFEIRGLDDMMQALNALEVEEVAAKMLEESVPILEQEVKKRSAGIKIPGICMSPSEAPGQEEIKEDTTYV